MVAPYPKERRPQDEAANERMEELIELVRAIRMIRTTYEVDPRRRIDVTVVAPRDGDFVREQAQVIRALARIERLEVSPRGGGDARRTIVHPVGAMEVRIPLAGLFDVATERDRLGRERTKIEGELEALRRKLGNPQFVERAKAQVVEESRARVSELEARRSKVEGTLAELGEA
jgi:valyl-tRNA synthetase